MLLPLTDFFPLTVFSLARKTFLNSLFIVRGSRQKNIKKSIYFEFFFWLILLFGNANRAENTSEKKNYILNADGDDDERSFFGIDRDCEENTGGGRVDIIL